MRKMNEMFFDASKSLVDDYERQIEHAHHDLENKDETLMKTQWELRRRETDIDLLVQQLKATRNDIKAAKSALKGVFQGQEIPHQSNTALFKTIQNIKTNQGKAKAASDLEKQLLETNLSGLQERVRTQTDGIERLVHQGLEKYSMIETLKAKDSATKKHLVCLQEDEVKTRINDLDDALRISADLSETPSPKTQEEEHNSEGDMKRLLAKRRVILSALKIALQNGRKMESQQKKLTIGLKDLSNLPASKLEDTISKLVCLSEKIIDRSREGTEKVSLYEKLTGP